MPAERDSGRVAFIRALASRALGHAVVKNALFLYVFQFTSFLVPLVTLPYLARVLGPREWGLVIFSQSVAYWLVMVLEFGFSLSATRDVAQSLTTPGNLREIVGGVFGAQLLLVGVISVSILAAAEVLPPFRLAPAFAAWAWLLALAQGANPVWYFLGQERLKRPVNLRLSLRLVSTAGIFLTVHSPSDGWKVLALQAAAEGLTSGALLVTVVREIQLPRLTLVTAVRALSRGWHAFFLRAAISTYTSLNTVLLGCFAPETAVSYFGSSERLARGAVGLIGPASQALYPRMSALVKADRNAASRLARLAFFAMGGLGIAGGATLMLLAPAIVRIVLGPQYAAATSTLRVLGLIVPLAAIGNVFTIQWMLPLGREVALNRIFVAAGVVNVILAAILAGRLQALGMAISVASAEVTVVVLSALYLHRRHIGFWRIRGDRHAS